MVSGVFDPSGFSLTIGNVLFFAQYPKAEVLQGSNDVSFGSIYREPGHERSTRASATNASRTGGSASRTSGPKVCT